MRKEDGISSVEVMIASLIAIIVLAGTMGAFNKSLNLNGHTNLLADLDQNLRAGSNFLVSDFLSAGSGIPTGGISIPSGEGSTPVSRPGPPNTSYKFDSPTVFAVNPGAGLGPAWNGVQTDMVNILYADDQLELNEWPLQAISSNAGGSSITVDARTPITGIDNPIREGDLIALTNANGNTLQCVTRVEGQTITFGNGDPFNLNQPGATQGSIATLRRNGVFPPTTANRVWLVSYYLDYTFDPSMPRLIRRINFRQGEAIALVLENLQLTYDIVDGDTNPTDVDTPTAPNSPNQIRKANIQISGRSSSEMLDTGDYMRRTLTTQVSLRSLSFIDRYR